MQSNLLETTVDDILRTALSESDSELLVVDPSFRTLESLVEVATSFDRSVPTLSVLARESVLKAVTDDFLTASRLADLVAAGHVELGLLETDAENSLLLSETSVLAIVTAGDQVAALGSTDDSFVENVRSSYQTQWADAESFGLRTPPLSEIRESLEERISEACRADFDAMVDAIETMGEDPIDEVAVSLLIAARNQVLLYDISKWGEDVGVASKATFSRTKTRLEDTGLIDTEKVPIDVGRPRLRLRLGEPYRDMEPAELVAAASETL
ncbi:MAG: transcriptional regulator TbsP [Halobacteriota archaeon]